MLSHLLPDLSSGRLPVIDRFNITNDLFALVEAGKTTADQFLQVLKASVDDDAYIVWGALCSGRGVQICVHLILWPTLITSVSLLAEIWENFATTPLPSSEVKEKKTKKEIEHTINRSKLIDIGKTLVFI